MKKFLSKIFVIILLVSILLFGVKPDKEVIKETVVVNKVITEFNSYNVYVEPVVYQGLTLTQLGAKIDKVFNSTLSGYGTYVAQIALDKMVDPVVAASIILVETGCKWTCSSLVRNNNNVGGMRSGGKYMTFSSLENGLEAFVNNLACNYYAKGLTTPELMNKKYAENPNWYKDVYYYVDLIM